MSITREKTIYKTSINTRNFTSHLLLKIFRYSPISQGNFDLLYRERGVEFFSKGMELTDMILNEYSSTASDDDLISIEPVTDKISYFGSPKSSPVAPSEKGFPLLGRLLDDGLHNRLEARFHVFPAACGSGKSNIVMEKISLWKANGFPGGGSVLISLGSFAEMQRFVDGCRLDKDDFACVTPEEKYARYGLGRGKAGDARVVFVTHQMVDAQLRKEGSFSAIADLHYRGHPRSLRIWDEALSPAEAVCFKVDDLAALPAHIRTVDRKLAEMIEAVVPAGSGRKDGERIIFSSEIVDAACLFSSKHRDWLKKRKNIKKVVDGIIRLVARHGFLRKDNLYGWMVVGTGTPIPDDMAPVIVLDASAKFKSTYAEWSSRSPLVIVHPPVWADYSRMTVRWWDRGAAKSTLAIRQERGLIATAIASLLNSAPEKKWLVVLSMEVENSISGPAYSLEKDITPMIDAMADNVQFLTWGKHIGTNDFREIKNVVIVGGLHYNRLGYEAISMAATGRAEGIDLQVIREIRETEFVHHVYQAACRSNVRNIEDGLAGEATIYLIAPNRARRQPYMMQAFPGCAIEGWIPLSPPKKSKAEIIMEAMLRLLPKRFTEISLKVLREECGAGGKKDYFRGVWDQSIIVDFMTKYRFRRVGNNIKRL